VHAPHRFQAATSTPLPSGRPAAEVKVNSIDPALQGEELEEAPEAFQAESPKTPRAT
jgi:hypothetical protein